MQALNLSVAVLDANTMEADDAADRQELLEIFMSGHDQVRRDMSNLGDRLGGIILDGQDQHAREFLAGQEQLAEELRQLKIAMERPPAPQVTSQVLGVILRKCFKCSSNKLPSRCRVVHVLEPLVWGRSVQSQRQPQLPAPLLGLACRAPERAGVLVRQEQAGSSRISEREEVEWEQG